MAGLIKSQILKHLSKFAKNLNSESINVSTWRGEGELKNLELNEDVLCDLMELPTWLRLTNASVNRVSVKIQWTKLKSVPIHLSLDEVVVGIETCENLRPHNQTGNTAASYASGGHYGFVDKVIDGMTVTVNSVHLTFKSPVFTGVFQLSRLLLDSRSPGWQKVVDLRMTRLKDPERNMLLLFKELSWQSVRIEVKSNNPDDKQLPPIRLITNGCHCRITIKKKLSDCSVMGCRLVVLLDDLLWVLTDSQLITACHFAQSLTDLVKQATQQSHKVKAVRKLESLPDLYSSHSNSGVKHTNKESSAAAAMSVFNKFDVIETSYHFVCEQIDLHLCDDPGSGRSSHPMLSSGASLQVTLRHLRVDYYPYHLALGDRSHWVRYIDCGPEQLCQGSLVHFRNTLVEALSGSRVPHTPLTRAPPHTSNKQQQSHGGAATSSAAPHTTQTAGGSQTSSSGISASAQSSQLRNIVSAQMSKLMVSCCVFSIRDFTVYRVSTAKRKQAPKEFVASDKERLCLPNNTSSVHLEFLNFYYAGDCDFPVPPPAVYGSVSPLRVVMDLLSVIWVNAFGRALQLAVLPDPATIPPQYLDMHVQFIMPRVVLEATSDQFAGQQKDRPRAMQVQASRVTLSNFRPPDPALPGSLASLANTLEHAQTTGELFFASGFPAETQDCLPVATKFVRHALGEDNIRSAPKCSGVSVYESISKHLSRESLWTEARDLLFLHCEPVWVEFTGTPTSKHRPLPFVDAFPLSVWIHLKMPGIKDGVPIVPGAVDDYSPVHHCPPSAIPPPVAMPASTGDPNDSVRHASVRVKREKSIGKKEAGLNVLVHCHSLVSCQLNHFQYLFLMRQVDMLTELSAFLTRDTKVIYDTASEEKTWIHDIEDNLVISVIVPQVDVSFVIPPLHPTKDSAMGDMEGFIPDSSSTVGEVQEIDSLREMRASTSDHSISQRLTPAGTSTTSAGNAGLQVDSMSTGTGADIAKSQSDGHLSSGSSSPHVAPHAPNVVTDYSCSSSKPHIVNPSMPGVGKSSHPTPVVNLISAPPCGPSSFNNNVPAHSIQDNLNIGFTSVRKGFSSFMTSLESSVKTATPEDISDTISIQSDLSSDSENFLLVNLESTVLGDRSDSGLGLEAAFRPDPSKAPDSLSNIEVAAEALEEEATTPSEEVSEMTSSFKRKNNIAVVNVQVSGVQFIQEAHGYDSVIKLQARHINVSDCNSIPYDEFQSKFSSRVRGWSHAFTLHQQCSFKVRLENKSVDDSAVTPPPPPSNQATDQAAAASVSSNEGTSVPKSFGPVPLTGSVFSKARVGSFALPHPLRKSLDQFQFEEHDGLNLWKRCTSYSPKIKHILPKWTRMSGEEEQQQSSVDGSSTATATDITASISSSSGKQAPDSSVPDSAVSTASVDDRSVCRYSVTELPVRVQSTLQVELGDLAVSLLLSSLTGLTELVQDELPPPPMECTIQLQNVSAHIVEDQASSHISVPTMASTRVIIPSLLVDRDNYGTFVIRVPPNTNQYTENNQVTESGDTTGSSENGAAVELTRLKSEVHQLRQALETCGNSLLEAHTENSSLKEAIRLLKQDCEHLQQTTAAAVSGSGDNVSAESMAAPASLPPSSSQPTPAAPQAPTTKH